jgi:magnesium transporter
VPLVNCVAYQAGVKLGDIPLEDISDYVQRPDCFVWVAVRDPQPNELDLLQEEFGLHKLAVEDARHGHQRPKIEEYGRSLFVVLPIMEVSGSKLHMGELMIFAGDNYVLSVRQHAEHGFTDVRRRTELEPDLLRHGSAYVLYALMDAVVDRYFPVIDALDDELSAVETIVFSDLPTRASIEALYELRQKLSAVKHAAGPLLEATGKLHGGRVPQICVGLQDYFRDIHDHLARLNQSIDNLRDTVTTVTSVNLALITLQESEVTKKLAAYAALVAVPTLVAGLYGMNFDHMPELEWQYGYPLALAVMGLIDGYLFYRFRKAKWL